MEKSNAEKVKDAGEKGHSLLRKLLVGATYVGSGIFFGLAAAGVDMSKLRPLAKGLVGLGVACLAEKCGDIAAEKMEENLDSIDELREDAFVFIDKAEEAHQRRKEEAALAKAKTV